MAAVTTRDLRRFRTERLDLRSVAAWQRSRWRNAPGRRGRSAHEAARWSVLTAGTLIAGTLVALAGAASYASPVRGWGLSHVGHARTCEAGPRERYATRAGSFSAAFPGRPTTVVVGTAAVLEQQQNSGVAFFWPTFTAAEPDTQAQIVSLQFWSSELCQADVVVQRLKPGDEAKLAALVSNRVNWYFYRVRGACVANWENPEGGPAYAVAVTPEVLLAATALEPTFSASRQFIASASLGHLPKGSLLLASPRPVGKRSCGTR